MQFIIGGICYIGGLVAMIFVGSLKLSFGLTAILAVPLVVLAVYGLARIPTEASAVKEVSKFQGVTKISREARVS